MKTGKAMMLLSLLPKDATGIQSWNLEDPFKVLIATILSQRSRDENTERAERLLFSKYSTASQLSSAPVNEIERLIHASGFYRVKARRVKEAARIIKEKYGGKVPADMEKLTEIPGVGRKTAGCVLVYGFGMPAIPVDTHVHRTSNRLGLVKTRSPERTEQELMKIIPKSEWIGINNTLVLFGKTTCKPIGPRCWDCPASRLCEWQGKKAVQDKYRAL